MLMVTPRDLLFQIFAMPQVKSFDTGEITGVRMGIEFLQTITGPNIPFEPLTSMEDAGEKTSAELREGLRKLSKLIKEDPRVEVALKELLGSTYLAARQEGAKAVLGKLTKMIQYTRV